MSTALITQHRQVNQIQFKKLFLLEKIGCVLNLQNISYYILLYFKYQFKDHKRKKKIFMEDKKYKFWLF